LEHTSIFFNLFAGIQSLLLVLFVSVRNSEDCTPRRILIAVILILHALSYFDLAIKYTSLRFEFSQIAFIGTTLYLLCPGLLYFYCRLKIDLNCQFKPVEYLHSLPFIFTFLVVYFDYWHATPAQQVSDVYFAQTIMATYWFSIIVSCVTLLQVAIAYRVLKKHQLTIINMRSDLEGVSLGWLVYLLVAFAGVWLIFFPLLGLNILAIKDPQLKLLFSTIQGIYGFTIVSFLIYYGAFSQGEFGASAALSVDEIAFEQEAERLSNKLNATELEDYQYQFSLIETKLPELIEQRKIFLDPNLTLLKMSKLCGISSKYLSKYINLRLGLNFNEYINNLRIEEAQQRLHSEPDTSITDIMYQSGFNSKSVFNTRFKQIVGVTPSHYRA
jgi:AraC-like DNA-binding protein